jgi:hypothetical protein
MLNEKCRLINTLKYIKMATSSNFGNIFSVLGTCSLLIFHTDAH